MRKPVSAESRAPAVARFSGGACPVFDLRLVRADMLDYGERLRDRDGRYGAYRLAPTARCDLYASCDIAIIRTIMGEDLAATLSANQRAEWCDQPVTGSKFVSSQTNVAHNKSAPALHPCNGSDHRHVMHHLELDALYTLVLMQKLSPGYRAADIVGAARRYGDKVRRYYDAHAAELYALHPHRVLAAAGTFGGLQQLLPDEFVDDVAWSDIFSDRRFYRTREVERC